MTLFHAGSNAKLDEIIATKVIPASMDGDGPRRVYVATDAAIAEVISHADGAVAVELDVDVNLEFGLGDSDAKPWAELCYEPGDDETGLAVVSARRV